MNETIYCAKCGVGMYWTPTPERPLCGDCAHRERGLDREGLIRFWRHVEQQNAPLRQGERVTPRHKLVWQARLRLRVLDPQVSVWKREYVKHETGLIVCRWKRYRLGEHRALVTV